MMPGDRLVCAFVNPQKVGKQFSKWPLHVTIVPWFRLKDNSEQVAEGLAKATAPIRPFMVSVVGKAEFGPKRNRPAHLLEPAEFLELERRVRNYLHQKRAWLVDETTKKPRLFVPHVTFQDGEHLTESSQLFCDRLFIVEQKGEYKELVGEVTLNE